MEQKPESNIEILKVSERIAKIRAKIQRCENKLASISRRIKEFEDTGLSHLNVSYDHGNGWQQAMPFDDGSQTTYIISEKTKLSILEDMRVAYNDLSSDKEGLQKSLLDEVDNLTKAIYGGI